MVCLQGEQEKERGKEVLGAEATEGFGPGWGPGREVGSVSSGIGRSGD